MQASLLLCTGLSLKLCNTLNNFVELLKESFSMALLAIANFNMCCPNNGKFEKTETVTSAFENLENCLISWIVRGNVIGGSMLGVSAYMESGKADKEIQVDRGVAIYDR